MDVKTTFLNKNLEEEVYMIQLEGYTSNEFPEKVCDEAFLVRSSKHTNVGQNFFIKTKS